MEAPICIAQLYDSNARDLYATEREIQPLPIISTLTITTGSGAVWNETSKVIDGF
jgi:hypothetical protein